MGEDEGLVLVQYRNRHLRHAAWRDQQKNPAAVDDGPHSTTARHATGEGPCTAPQVGSKGKRSCPASRAVMRDIERVTALGRQATRQKPTRSRRLR